MKHTRTILFGFSLVTIGLLATFSSASALTISPPIAEVSLDPGVQTNVQIKLFNETEKTLTLYTEIVNWSAQDETGTPAFALDEQAFGFATWITLNEGPIIVEPLENIALIGSIMPPQDADPGGHYAAIFFSENPPNTEGGGQVAIGSKVTALLLGEVAGDIQAEGRIRSFTTDSFMNRLPVDFALRFENTGNIHLRPTGSITISNIFGGTTDSIDVNTTKGATLPGQIRQYSAVWEKNMVDDTNTGFFNEFKNEWNNFALGKYTASASLTSETEEGFITHNAETSFWVIPWRVMIGVVFAIAIIVFFISFFVSRYNTWIIKKAQEHGTGKQNKK